MGKLGEEGGGGEDERRTWTMLNVPWYVAMVGSYTSALLLHAA